MTKPSFQAIIDRQRAADHRLTHDKRFTEPERAFYQRTLEPVPLIDVEIPKLPMVRIKSNQNQYVALGEIAQIPGKIVLIDVENGKIILETADQLELVPPKS